MTSTSIGVGEDIGEVLGIGSAEFVVEEGTSRAFSGCAASSLDGLADILEGMAVTDASVGGGGGSGDDDGGACGG